MGSKNPRIDQPNPTNISYLGCNDRTLSLESSFFWPEIIPFYGRTIQVSEILKFSQTYGKSSTYGVELCGWFKLLNYGDFAHQNLHNPMSYSVELLSGKLTQKKQYIMGK